MKIVIIGGHASSLQALEKIKKDYQKKYTKAHIIFFRFSYAMAHVSEVAEASKGAHVIVHSAGCLLLKHIDNMISTVVIAPLQSKSRRQYAFGFAKQYSKEKHHPMFLLELFKFFELVKNPVSNVKWLWNEAMSSHDFESELPQIVQRSAHTKVVLYKNDKVFRLDDYPVESYRSSGAEVIILKGGHDSFYFDHPVTIKH